MRLPIDNGPFNSGRPESSIRFRKRDHFPVVATTSPSPRQDASIRIRHREWASKQASHSQPDVKIISRCDFTIDTLLFCTVHRTSLSGYASKATMNTIWIMKGGPGAERKAYPPIQEVPTDLVAPFAKVRRPKPRAIHTQSASPATTGQASNTTATQPGSAVVPPPKTTAAHTQSSHINPYGAR